MIEKLTRFSLFLFLCLLLNSSLLAQSSIGFGFNYTQALSEYSDNLYKNPTGLSISYNHFLQKLPKWRFGAEAGVSMYANDTYMLSLSDDNNDTYTIEIDEEDCFLSYNLNAKYFAIGDNRRINPYLEAKAGGVSFFSTRMTDDEYVDLYASSTNFHGSTFMYGAGGGIVTRILHNLSLDMNVIANRGNKTYYRSIEPNDDNLVKGLAYGHKESYTNNINYKLGLLFGF